MEEKAKEIKILDEVKDKIFEKATKNYYDYKNDFFEKAKAEAIIKYKITENDTPEKLIANIIAQLKNNPEVEETHNGEKSIIEVNFKIYKEEKIKIDVKVDKKNIILKFKDVIDKFIFEVVKNKGGVTDFTKDLISLANAYPNILRLFLYKIYANEFEFDCDVTKNALDSLKHFLPKDSNDENKCVVQQQTSKKHKYEILVMQNGIQRTYRGDTMNSFWGLFKSFLQNCLSSELGLDGKSVPVSNRFFGNGFKSWMYNFIIKYNKVIEITGTNKEILDNFEKFAKLNHTLGNFILVPFLTNYSYNNARNSEFKDCFDLCLDDIKKFYDADNSDTNTKIKYKEKNIDYWLESYGFGKTGFERFINKNHLNCYVDENNNIIDLSSEERKIKTFESDKLREFYIPTNEDDIKKYLQNVINNIETRNTAITKD